MILHRGGGPDGRVAEVAPLRPGWPAFAGNNPIAIGKTLRLRTALERFATWRVVVASLVGFAACSAGLAWRQLRLGGFALLDSRGWYTPEEAAALFDGLDRLDANARAIYAATGLTIDMAFPIAYGVLFATLLFHLFRDGPPLYLLPIALAAADALENVTVAALVLSHTGEPSPFAWMAAVFTLAKTGLMAATFVAVGIGGARWLWFRLRR